jgi:hypothetical protein
MTSRMSVAVVLIAPVIIIAACRWIVASLLMIAQQDFPFVALVVVFRCGVRKMSAAYSMHGAAIER